MVCSASFYRAPVAVQRPYPKPPDINTYDMFSNKKMESQFFVCVYYSLDGTIQMIKLDCDGFYFGESMPYAITCHSAFSYSVKANAVSCFVKKHCFQLK